MLFTGLGLQKMQLEMNFRAPLLYITLMGRCYHHLRLLIGFTGVLREILHTRAPFDETMENYISL